MLGHRGILAVSLGAAKSGTSWLFDQLAGLPGVHAPVSKEQHYFNNLDESREAHIAKLEARLVKYTANGNAARADEVRAQLAMFNGDVSGYLSHVATGAKTQDVVMDFTPAYGLLSRERLLEIQNFANTRFIFLMRDPVARLWSNIRMDARRAVRQSGDFAETSYEMLESVLAGGKPAIRARGDYKGMLDRFSGLDAKRVFISFYEELFTDETMTRICDFLEIAARPLAFDKRVNEGRALAMVEADRARAAEYLKPQYAAVQAHMGRLPDSWKQNAGVA